MRWELSQCYNARAVLLRKRILAGITGWVCGTELEERRASLEEFSRLRLFTA